MMSHKEFQKMATNEFLEEKANEIASTIVIRSYDEHGNSHDDRRESTEEERKVLKALAEAAMLAYRSDGIYHNVKQEDCCDSIISAIEYACIGLLPQANCYDSIYTPLQKTMGKWS